ncbi:hypothetical protein P2H44_11125 [Albimonas sp. CAU 1670]|uniref:hypothetical protein n=1 Tax=Albimonas sp. CAU 1670 TaxID=3032599 RepID=UPI0023DC9BE7|nr:hypothetical protein [Albimonas sp. CAU 1670]MDF2233104.1 hypothetical protein [Albimonas sp. CAU 1670]
MTIPSWDGPDFLTSDGGYAKYRPQIVALADGDFAVVWAGFRGPDVDADQGQTLIARIFDADRNPRGASFEVPGDLDGSQSDFLVTATADGGFAVLYTDVTVASDPGSFVARFDKTGARVADDAKVSEGTGAVGVAGLSDGSVAVLRVIYGPTSGIVATIVDETNTVGATDVPTGAAAVSIGGENILSPLGDGAAFVELSGGASSRSATLHVLGADGAVVSSTPLIASENSFGNYLGQVLPDGRAVVALSFQDGDASVLRVRLFGADGAALTDATFDPDPDGDNYPSQIVPSPDGGFLVLMTSGDVFGPDKQEAIALKFDADGEVEGEAFPIHRESAGFQSRAHGAWLEGGDFIAVWEDSPTASVVQIMGQGFDPSGTTAGNAPTDIVLTGDPIEPGVQGQTIGTLSAVDPDADESFVFSFVDPYEALRFEIVGDELRFNPAIAPTDIYAYNQVQIRVTDAQFNTYVETLTIPFAGTEPEPQPRNLVGTKKKDTLEGAAGDDVLKGKGGKDKLLGRDGDDDLRGDGGKDLVRGDAGDDRLDGGKGRDRLIGGEGADQFVLDGKGGPDRVKDFADGFDTLAIASGASEFDDLKLRGKGDDVLLKDGRVKLAILEDVDKADLDASDFVFV